MQKSKIPLQKLIEAPIVVLGAGRSGLAATELLLDAGCQVVLVDAKKEQDLFYWPSFLKPNHPRLRVSFGQKESENFLSGARLLVLSPGISFKHPFVALAQKKGLPILNEIDCASLFLPHCTFVGITGTNGKSTTTVLIGSIFKQHSENVFVGGNLGEPLCRRIFSGDLPEYAILELSSYQLEALQHIELSAAVFTNFGPDHLDRYPSLEHYFSAKCRIFERLKPAGVSILNYGDQTLKNRVLSKQNNAFCFQVPPSLRGVWAQNEEAFIIDKNQNFTLKLPRSHLAGEHNVENASAAIACAYALGVSVQTIERGLKTYEGIAHRFENLGEINGIFFINDSKATNIDALSKALNTVKGPIQLILGGLGKNEDFGKIKVWANQIDSIYAIGQEACRIISALGKDIETHASETLDQAVLHAFSKAKPGHTILLSPACASYDQYQNFEQRGEHFRGIFSQLQITLLKETQTELRHPFL